MVQCPRCNIQVSELHPIDSNDLHRLQEMGESPPPQVCLGCLSDIRKTLANTTGGVLMAQERAREQHRLMLWHSRVNLIRKARSYMSSKMYSDAAVSYEKYLKILEIVFNCKKGETITPEQFKDTARTSELTVVASVYWDLLRIYDSNEKYADRQMNAAKQLAVFVQFTPIFPDIIKRAEVFVKTAKNPTAIKYFLKNAVGSRPRCFIATAAFEDAWAPEVIELRLIRDYQLMKTFWGRLFVRLYYLVSPVLAQILNRNSWAKPTVRRVLRRLI